MNAKHTPGPWMVGPTYGNDSARIDTEGGTVIGSIKVKQLVSVDKGHANYAWSNELYANARLVAAAPELLDVLQRCIAVMESRCPEASPLPDARAAIAKATGS